MDGDCWQYSRDNVPNEIEFRQKATNQMKDKENKK